MKLKNNVKGITLIALVVTIIVLLILAGIALNLTIGENGLITRAQDAVIINENASVYEQLQLVITEYQMENITNNIDTEILTKLKEDGYVDADNSVDVENLMGRRMQTGKGNVEDGDVYVLEQRQRTASSATSDANSSIDYYLIYYDEDKTDTNLGMAFEKNKAKYELRPEGIFHDYDEIIVYYPIFGLLDQNNNLVEFGDRVVIKQNGTTYFDGSPTKYIENNVLDISDIYYDIYFNRWNNGEIIEIIVYKDDVPYSWSGYVSWPV